jgi:PKD repeat protein
LELAITLPLLLVLLCGAIDFGRLFFARVAIENAANQGAFFGAQNPRCDVDKAGCSDPENVHWHASNEAPGLTPLTITAECLDGGGVVPVTSCEEDHGYRVSVGYQFTLVTPILSSVLGGGIELESVATARVLNTAFDPAAPPVPAPCGEPIATFSVSTAPNNSKSPVTATFSNASGAPAECPILTYAWDFGNGNTSSAVNPAQQTYTNPGPSNNKNFTITLTVTNDGGSNTATRTITVKKP